MAGLATVLRQGPAGQTLALSWRLLWRALRAGEVRLLALALLVAMMAVTAVSFFTDRVHRALTQESRQLLGADLVLVADAPWSADIPDRARQEGLRMAETWTFPSMVRAGNQVLLADVKAVSPGYPLRGALRLSETRAPQGLAGPSVPTSGEVWGEAGLFQGLGAGLGDTVQLGQRPLALSAIIALEPDRSSNFLGVAPRLMMALADVPASGLIQPGARVSYRLLLAGDEPALARFQAWLEPRLARGQRLEDVNHARPEVRSALERAQRFLGMSSLLSVVLAAVVVALSAKRYVVRHLDTCALLRCFGASGRQLLLLHGGQLLGLGLLSGSLGSLGGYLAQRLLDHLLSAWVPVGLPPPGGLPWVYGPVMAVLLMLGFAGPPLLQLSRVSTLRVLRQEMGAAPLSVWAAYGLGVGLLVAMLVWVAGDGVSGAWMALGLSGLLGAFALLARGSVALVTRWVPEGHWVWRQGVLSLRRHAWASTMQIAALALGLTAMALLTLTRGELMAAWQAGIPGDAPNRFVINIQPDQTAAVGRFLQEEGLPAEFSPMIRGRLLRVNQRPVSAADYPRDEQAQRLVEREFNLSWRDDLPPGNRVVAGRWFEPGEQGVASVEEGLAKKLGLGVGSELVFGIAGQEKTLRVVGLRKLQWDSMRVNFFVLTPRQDLDQAPASYITSLYLRPDQSQVPSRLARAFPNLTVIDIAAILDQLRRVVDEVSRAVQLVFVFTLVSGLIVLYAALVSAFAARQHELALMRALGASRRQLFAALLVEVGLIGGLAGALAGLGAEGLGRVLAERLFSLEMPWHWEVVPLMALCGMALSLGVGLRAIRRMLNVSPLVLLREST